MKESPRSSSARSDRFEWQGPDSFPEDGVLVDPPPDFQKDKKYPLVSGDSRWTDCIFYHRVFSFLSQLLAAHSYIVFMPNYRGSDNLGNAYQRAIFNDAGDGPGRDVIAGIDALKEARTCR